MPCPTPGCQCQFIPDHFVSQHNKVDDRTCFCGHPAYMHTFSSQSGRKRARELSSQSNTNTNASPSTDSDGTQPARTSAELMTIFASKKIKTDLMVVYNGLMNTAGYNTEKAKIHTNELAKFLLLKALDSDLDDTSLSPSPNIEEVWRTFMSVPQVYIQFCRELLGRDAVIGHNLMWKKSLNWCSRYSHTLDRYKAVFNESPRADVWPSAIELATNAVGAATSVTSGSPRGINSGSNFSTSAATGNIQIRPNSSSSGVRQFDFTVTPIVPSTTGKPTTVPPPPVTTYDDTNTNTPPSMSTNASANSNSNSDSIANSNSNAGIANSASQATTTAPVPANSTEETVITVRVEETASDKPALGFMMKTSALLGKMFDHFCTKRQLERDSVDFIFEGKTLQPQDTPSSLNLKEGNTIKVVAKTSK